MERFTLYIDESGEAGIEKVRSDDTSGASPYMTLGATLVPHRSKDALVKGLEDLRIQTRRKSLHCARLNHYQLIHFARFLAQRRVRLFGVISRKSTLGYYRTQIDDDSGKYYNKCVQYLLERVGCFMQVRGLAPDSLDIVFEKANHDYNKMKNYLLACQANPRHPNTARLRHLEVKLISALDKADEPLLQTADLVAHALYKCVDKNPKQHGIPEPRYLKELSSRFFGDPDENKVVGGGLYCVHSTNDLGLDDDVRAILDDLRADPPPA